MGSPVSPARGPRVNRFPRYTGAMLGRILAIMALLAGPAVAQSLPREITLAETSVAAEALDGDTVRLHDGREVRLAGIAAPKPPLPRAGTAVQPDRRLDALIAATRRHLDERIRDRPLDLYPITPLADRHGRLVAHVATAGGVWLQADLVGEGLALVQAADARVAGMANLLRIEAQARAARRGIWTHPLFQVRRPEEAGRWLDTFQLVEGAVAAVRSGRGNSRIEIGTGERRLTVVVAATTRSTLRRAGVDLAALPGHTVRARGWLRWQDGARLDLAHAEALELLEP